MADSEKEAASERMSGALSLKKGSSSSSHGGGVLEEHSDYIIGIKYISIN
ncbi:MAG: hypothetical protein GX918_03180 [Clostridiales bacterium]|nr:hypothetical protein [Clostridiales bacterium]